MFGFGQEDTRFFKHEIVWSSKRQQRLNIFGTQEGGCWAGEGFMSRRTTTSFEVISLGSQWLWILCSLGQQFWDGTWSALEVFLPPRMKVQTEATLTSVYKQLLSDLLFILLLLDESLRPCLIERNKTKDDTYEVFKMKQINKTSVQYWIFLGMANFRMLFWFIVYYSFPFSCN